MRFEPHISAQILLQMADGELSPRREAKARKHLLACRSCRAKQQDLATAIDDLAALRLAHSETPLPAANRSRLLLRAGLAKLSSERQAQSFRLLPEIQNAPAIATALLVITLGLTTAYRFAVSSTQESNFTNLEPAPLPDRNLTPGSIRAVTTLDVCSVQAEPRIPTVPASVREAVFEKYGIAQAKPQDYELDYLITPELGGSTDIHNLWPEPRSSVWNSFVKDDLENRLHQLVCQGKVDLPTAQREIATDWISAYKKYFDTDHPLLGSSSKS